MKNPISPPRKVYISCLPSTILDSEIIAYFQKFGQIKNLEVKRDSENPAKCQGFCKMECDSAEMTETILSKRHVLKDKILRITPFYEGKELERYREHTKKCRIFIKNLPKETEDQHLHTFFSKYGGMTRAYCVSKKKYPGKKFGYVVFKNAQTIEKIPPGELNFNGVTIKWFYHSKNKPQQAQSEEDPSKGHSSSENEIVSQDKKLDRSTEIDQAPKRLGPKRFIPHHVNTPKTHSHYPETGSHLTSKLSLSRKNKKRIKKRSPRNQANKGLPHQEGSQDKSYETQKLLEQRETQRWHQTNVRAKKQSPRIKSKFSRLLRDELHLNQAQFWVKPLLPVFWNYKPTSSEYYHCPQITNEFLKTWSTDMQHQKLTQEKLLNRRRNHSLSNIRLNPVQNTSVITRKTQKKRRSKADQCIRPTEYREKTSRDFPEYRFNVGQLTPNSSFEIESPPSSFSSHNSKELPHY